MTTTGCSKCFGCTSEQMSCHPSLAIFPQLHQLHLSQYVLFRFSAVIWLWTWLWSAHHARTHTNNHPPTHINVKPSPAMLALMPSVACGNYPYRLLQRLWSHRLSEKESNYNANKGKLSRLMEVMFHVLFLLPVALGEKKQRNPIISSNCIDCVLPW